MEQIHQRNERLIENKIWKYLLPGIMMSLALQLGNIVDTVFVGNFLGTEAMSAITLVLPMETLIQVTGYCLGMGGLQQVFCFAGEIKRAHRSYFRSHC